MAGRGSSKAPIFGITLTIAALSQMTVYASVVLYSLLVGGIDLVIPIKSAFLTMILVILFKSIDNLAIAWRSRRWDSPRFNDNLALLAIEIIGFASFFLFEYRFLSQPLSNIDLTHESIDVRGLVSVGGVLLIIFVLGEVRELIRSSLTPGKPPTQLPAQVRK